MQIAYLQVPSSSFSPEALLITTWVMAGGFAIIFAIFAFTHGLKGRDARLFMAFISFSLFDAAVPSMETIYFVTSGQQVIQLPWEVLVFFTIFQAVFLTVAIILFVSVYKPRAS